ncbi:hypothetical protein BK004_01985 [bacterium CG10_46_32]|nr:MAG: hypothetical protein BK004_01985 [bacterium CG10_46_32]PIR56204.1 MAG: hypothetical protein COU73_02010 [Parcubacteria group bacterium CG10_big_fil_rev_8_21_14_0_10_46_32]
MNHTTNLVIISGPSGGGEDSVIESLIKRGLPIERVVTTVDRPMRPGESEGHPYYFKSRKEIDSMIANDEFAERAEVYGSKRGATKKELERVMALKNKIGIWKMDWKGSQTAKKEYPDALAIFITAENIDKLIERLKKRGDAPEYIQSRIEYTKEYYDNKGIYDYEVINEEGKLEQTVDKVIAILKKESYLDNNI